MSKSLRYLNRALSFKNVLNEEAEAPLLIMTLKAKKLPETTEECTVTEASVSDKVTAILAGEKDIPAERKTIIADIVKEFDHTKEEILALQKKMEEKIMENDPEIVSIFKQVNELDADVLETLSKNREKFIKIIQDGMSEEGHLKDFVIELLADLASFTDEQLVKAYKLENRLANLLLA